MQQLENSKVVPYPQPLQKILGEQLFQLHYPFSYLWQYEGHYFRIVVPPGFKYDGATIPRIAWSLIGLRPVGLISAAACVHDWMYCKGGVLGRSYEMLKGDTWIVVDHAWIRSDADRLFARMLREAGVGVLQRRLAYAAVSVFGGKHYG